MNLEISDNDRKEIDLSFLSEETIILAGTDEAGRGPLAGPVVAAAVIFDNSTLIKGIRDSKKLNAKRRGQLYAEITAQARCWGVGISDIETIRKINILNASLQAMRTAVNKLNIQPDIILVDGNRSPGFGKKERLLVRGDLISFSIAAASIIAKVTRDRIMSELSIKFPEYGWDRNMGYATKEHIAAIKKYGATPHHRISFLKKILNPDIQTELFNELIK